MAWLSVATVLVAGCDKGASPRLFTDDEVTALVDRAHTLDPYTEPDFGRDDDVHVEIQQFFAGDPTRSLVELGCRISTFEAVYVVLKPIIAAQRTSELEQLVGAALYLLPRAQPTKDELDELAFRLDAALQTYHPFAPDMNGWIERGRALVIATGHVGSIPASKPDERALYLAASDALTTMAQQNCTKSLAECSRGLAAKALPHVTADDLLAQHATEIRHTTNAMARHALEAALADRLARGLLATYQFELGWRATVLTQLVALRLAVEARRTAVCDTQVRLGSPPILGEALTISTHDNIIEVSPPTWAARPDRRSFAIACR